MTQSAMPAGSAPAKGRQPALWKPLVYRATVALAFGALTIFWSTPSAFGMGIASGVYLGATGVLLLQVTSAAGLARQRTGKLLVTGAVALIIAGAGVAAFHDAQLYAIVAAGGLGVSGLAEVAAGIAAKNHGLARDWLISGVIALGAAVALPFFSNLGAHALLGVAGGAAIMTGVLWMLSGLTVRHEAEAAVQRP